MLLVDIVVHVHVTKIEWLNLQALRTRNQRNGSKTQLLDIEDNWFPRSYTCDVSADFSELERDLLWRILRAKFYLVFSLYIWLFLQLIFKTLNFIVLLWHYLSFLN